MVVLAMLVLALVVLAIKLLATKVLTIMDLAKIVEPHKCTTISLCQLTH